MSAEPIRRAVQKMRELASGAHQGPWALAPASEEGSIVEVYSVETLTRYSTADPLIARVERGEQVEGMPEGYGVMSTPEFIASWPPEIADIAALALEQHADLHDNYDCTHEPCAHLEWALMYLGEAEPDGA